MSSFIISGCSAKYELIGSHPKHNAEPLVFKYSTKGDRASSVRAANPHSVLKLTFFNLQGTQLQGNNRSVKGI